MEKRMRHAVHVVNMSSLRIITATTGDSSVDTLLVIVRTLLRLL
jgi:hypothetical protein